MLTGTEAVAIGNDGGGNLRTAHSVGAVADSIAKVDVLTEADIVIGSAAKFRKLSEHVRDTGVLEESQPLEILNKALRAQLVPLATRRTRPGRQEESRGGKDMVEMDVNLHHKLGGSEPKPTRRMRRRR